MRKLTLVLLLRVSVVRTIRLSLGISFVCLLSVGAKARMYEPIFLYGSFFGVSMARCPLSPNGHGGRGCFKGVPQDVKVCANLKLCFPCLCLHNLSETCASVSLQ